MGNGPLIAGWQVKTLNELCEIARGGSPRPIKKFLTDAPDGVNWIKISDATASSKYIYKTKKKIKQEGIQRSRLVKEGDFLLSNSMSFGRPYIMKTTGCIHDGWLVLRDKSGEFDQDFLYYFLGSAAAYKQFDNLAAGSTVRNLNIDLVKGVRIPLPPLPEQKRIVAILDKAFAGIRQAVTNAEKNLANARELFESYMNKVFTQKGEGWVEKKLGEVCNFLNGFAFKSADAVQSSNVQLIRMGNLYQNALDLDRKPSFYPSNFEEEYALYVLSEGDLIMSLTGTVDKEDYGYTVEIPVTNQVLLLNQRIAKFTNIREEQINRRYFLYCLRSRFFLKQLYGSARGVRQANLSSASMKNLAVIFPELNEQKRLLKKFDILYGAVKNLETIYQQKLTALTELKQSILQKAFTSELTTDTAKQQVNT